ncbi:trehalose-phosphatase [Celerinatantimonas diazotrophica]|uniref:Trehalose 6-phosphate phosphatase n=1 Tax=Celerinatantimonas diazotrophica TaxID=412034 RepID=A0A4R1J800_9GAMM|nr:trehalose-phosphatase [Celerinatantimonas diazotrophica]TCK46612.1 trehalose 6-phosphatase [Celerinatantimonas diazotrophica]CAG9296662.1 Trehalose-6-phosphate phosphatase [Celerinatantimonas diazotrophica]
MKNKLPELILNQSAMFLDFDGTLVDLQPTPDAVVVTEQLRNLLTTLDSKTNHALAIISGRSIESLDKLLRLPLLLMGGSHGMQFRKVPFGDIVIHPDVTPLPDKLMSQCKAFCENNQLLWEAKPLSSAIHYRNNPKLEIKIDEYLDTLVHQYSGVNIQRGKYIRELKPKGVNKASALEFFMQNHHFTHKTPWYFGDDTTDEDAFSWVKQHNGIAVKVGEGETIADYHLQSPQDVFSFLSSSLYCEE